MSLTHITIKYLWEIKFVSVSATVMGVMVMGATVMGATVMGATVMCRAQHRDCLHKMSQQVHSTVNKVVY